MTAAQQTFLRALLEQHELLYVAGGAVYETLPFKDRVALHHGLPTLVERSYPWDDVYVKALDVVDWGNTDVQTILASTLGMDQDNFRRMLAEVE